MKIHNYRKLSCNPWEAFTESSCSALQNSLETTATSSSLALLSSCSQIQRTSASASYTFPQIMVQNKQSEYVWSSIRHLKPFRSLQFLYFDFPHTACQTVVHVAPTFPTFMYMQVNSLTDMVHIKFTCRLGDNILHRP
jgi:hypothetical protein